MPNRYAFLILCAGAVVFAIMARACVPAPAASQPRPTRASATWAPGPYEPLGGRVWLPATGATVRDSRMVGAWAWVDAAVARAADKPTAAPTPTRTATASATRPPRPTRTPRPTGTPTQGPMNTVPACGAGTTEPGEGTPFPNCWPYSGTLTPTPTLTPWVRDTPPASATWEPTPSPVPKATPITGGWVEAPGRWVYLFPLILVSRLRP